MEFTKKFKACTTRLRFSQEEVARAVGVSQSLVSNWAKGKATPDMREALALARLFGVPMEYLADDAMGAPPEAYSSDERALIGVFRGSGYTIEEAAERLSPDTVIASRRRPTPG